MKRLTKTDRNKIIQLINASGNLISAQIKAGNIDINEALCKFIAFSDKLDIIKNKKVTMSYISSAKQIMKRIDDNAKLFHGTNVLALNIALKITIDNQSNIIK